MEAIIEIELKGKEYQMSEKNANDGDCCFLNYRGLNENTIPK